MQRREFFSSLIAAGATPRKTRKHVKHTGDIQIYHGPMTIPPYVAEAIREDPTPHRATGRGTHLISRYAEPDATVWLFRCQVPEHRGMVGEIVRTPESRYRVHCWSAAHPGDYLTADERIDRDRAARNPPPMERPQPREEPEPAEYSTLDGQPLSGEEAKRILDACEPELDVTRPHPC